MGIRATYNPRVAEHWNQIHVTIHWLKVSTTVTDVLLYDLPMTRTGREATDDDLLSEKRLVFEFRI
jgi:hypothetical protein